MRTRCILIGIFFTILLAESVAAENPYGKIYKYDAYYNDKLLLGTDAAKPDLRIGEPFTVGINLTVYQKSEVSVQLNEIGEGYFVIVDGPTSKMNVYRADIVEKNSSKLYKWTVTPTEKWAGGSIPIDIVYQINDFKTGDVLVNSEFTVACCTISNEHYKGEVPTPKDQKVSETETAPTSKPASMPGFSLVTAIAALAFVVLRFSRQ